MTKVSVAAASIVVTACLIIAGMFALAPEQGIASSAAIGTVKEVRGGTLERQERDVWKPLAANAAINTNDRVRTGAGATAILSLNDIGTVMVGPGTEYYMGDPSRGFKSLLKRGYLWVTTKLKPGATMSVATANAVAGVRGTKFSVIQDGEGVNICTCKGEVQVTANNAKPVNLTSGMYGEIDRTGKMGAPEKGKPRLEMIWKNRPARYAPCLECHRKGKKIGDLS